MSTFTLPRALAGDVGRDVAAPGVGAYDSRNDAYTVKVSRYLDIYGYYLLDIYNVPIPGVLPVGAIRPVPPGWAVLRSSSPLQELGRGKGEGWMETKVFSAFYVLHLISG